MAKKKIIPKVEFVYSVIYNRLWSSRIENYNPQKNRLKMIKYIEGVEKEWRKIEKKILNEISKIMALKWSNEKIYCYPIENGKSFSKPLTVRWYKQKNDFIDTLIHELIHVIEDKNIGKQTIWQNWMEKNYLKEPRKTKNHILLHAVHEKIYLKFFDKKRMARKKIEHENRKFKDYRRAWEIVERDGADNIIKKFREITK